MKIGVFSDLHSNSNSLLEIKRIINEEKLDKIFFCGDAVGYYFDHNEVLDFLRENILIIPVLGNHDKMFLDSLDDQEVAKEYKKNYGHSINFFLNSVTNENIEFLKKIPLKQKINIENLSILCVHGTPWDPLNGYFYPNYEIKLFDHYNYDYIFFGHTHYRTQIKTKFGIVINPGSSGQPRDGKMPSFVVIDTASNIIRFIDLKYSNNKLFNQISNIKGLPSYLSEVLKRGPN
jgi:putative phosphoesterase